MQAVRFLYTLIDSEEMLSYNSAFWKIVLVKTEWYLNVSIFYIIEELMKITISKSKYF